MGERSKSSGLKNYNEHQQNIFTQNYFSNQIDSDISDRRLIKGGSKKDLTNYASKPDLNQQY